jgi:alpha-galactosidase-like protein
VRRSLITSLAALALVVSTAPAFGQTQDKPTEPAPPVTDIGPGAIEVTKTGLSVNGKAVEAAPAGVEVTLTLTFRNAGSEALKDVNVMLSIPPEGTRLTDPDAALGDLAAGESADGEFAFLVAGDCFEFLGFGGKAVHSGGSVPLKVAVPAVCPGPRLTLSNVTFEGGDGDGVPEPGETLRVTFELANQGKDLAKDVRASVKISGDGLSAAGTDLEWPDIEPGGTARNTAPLILSISKDAERQKPCTPGPGVSIQEDRAFAVDDKELPPDSVVSSDGNVSSGGGSGSTGAAGSAPGSEPAPNGQTQPGSTGSGGTAVAEPPASSVEPQPYQVDPTPGTGGGSDPGTTEPGTIEPEPVGPAPDQTGKPVPMPEPIEPQPNPEPAEDQPAQVQALLTVTATGYETAAEWANTTYCTLEMGAPGVDGTFTAAERDSAANTDQSDGGGAAVPVSLALGISALTAVAHRKFAI